MPGFQIAAPLVLGLSNGAGIGLVAIGLVLIYKSTRVFNFAAGEFLTLGAYGAYIGHQTWSLPFPVAVLIGLAFGTLAGLVTERLVVRPLANRPRVTILVATTALVLVAIPLELIIGSSKFFPSRAVIRGIGFKVPVAGVYMSWQQFLTIGILAGVGLLLAFFFARTALGLATLATSQEPTASRLVGIRLNRVSMLTWGLAGLLGGLAGVMLAGGSQFQAGYGTTTWLIAAFTAAVVGGMTSVPGAFLGGVLVGLVQSFAQINISSDTLPGANSVATLVMLVIVLLARPTGLLGSEA